MISESPRSVAAWCSLLVLAGFALRAVWRARKCGDRHAAHLFYGAAHLQGVFFLLADTHEDVGPILLTTIDPSADLFRTIYGIVITRAFWLFSANLALNLAMVVMVSIVCRTRPKPGLVSILGAGAISINFLLLVSLMLALYASVK